MKATVKPSRITGIVAPPASKSMMQRVCAAALLNTGETIIYNPGTSNDDKAALSIVTQLGGAVITLDNYLSIKSKGIAPVADVIDCGESGLSTRLFTPVAALADGEITVTGHGSLLRRPMTEIGKTLPQLGVLLPGFNEYLPIRLQGPLQAASITMDGSLSSQYLSGILFALAFSAKEQVTITVHNLTSKPYIDLSLAVLSQFGRVVENQAYQQFVIQPVAQGGRNIVTTIETDWSSAVAWVVAGAIAGPVTIQNLNIHSAQADRAIIDIAADCGASLHWNEQDLTVSNSGGALRSFFFNATEAPDLFPVLSILAASCTGVSRIQGLHRLTHKESNRSASVQQMLTAFGVPFWVEEDTLCVEGVQQFNAAEINTWNDHRLVMAAAVASLKTAGEVIIQQSEAVNKSYPAFFQDLSLLSNNKITFS